MCYVCVCLCVCQCVCCVFLVLSFLGGILYWTESLTTTGAHKGHSISPADTDRKKDLYFPSCHQQKVILFHLITQRSDQLFHLLTKVNKGHHSIPPAKRHLIAVIQIPPAARQNHFSSHRLTALHRHSLQRCSYTEIDCNDVL